MAYVRPRRQPLTCNDHFASGPCGTLIVLLVKGAAKLPMVLREVLSAGTPSGSTFCLVIQQALILCSSSMTDRLVMEWVRRCAKL